MGDCEQTLRELDSFLDGELSDDSHEGIRRHLDGCPDCLGAFDFHAELRAVIAEKCQNDELPAGLVERLEDCLRTELGKEADG